MSRSSRSEPPSRSRLVLIFLLTFALGLVIDYCDLTIGAEAAVPSAGWSASSQARGDAADEVGSQIACWSEGVPCSWPPNGLRNANRADVLGPRQVRIPSAWRTEIKREVRQRGGRLLRNARDIPWWEDTIWYSNCAAAIALSVTNGS